VRTWTFTAAAAQVAAHAEVAYRTEIRDPPQVTTLTVVFATAE
jgi:hypothetical protein